MNIGSDGHLGDSGFKFFVARPPLEDTNPLRVFPIATQNLIILESIKVALVYSTKC